MGIDSRLSAMERCASPEHESMPTSGTMGYRLSSIVYGLCCAMVYGLWSYGLSDALERAGRDRLL